MKVVILAGGFGTRLDEETMVKPKPMLEIAGRPMLWHIMSIYAAQGFNEFIIALGYRGDVIKSYMHSYYYLQGDLTIRLSESGPRLRPSGNDDWTIHLVETGINTATGGRIKRLVDWIGDEPFMLTYGDGLADIDLGRLLGFHRSHGRLATVTAVRPPARFGALTLDGDLVSSFAEKSQVAEGWINGGFFVLEPTVIERIEGDSTDWERGPLEGLARDGQLAAFRHEGFWQCVDTQRDLRYLEGLCAGTDPPWHRTHA